LQLRNHYFIDLLRTEAQLTSEACEVMCRGLENDGSCGMEGFRKVERLRRRAGRIDRLITERLERTLITPLAPEDIRSISVRLTGILESLTEAAWHQSTLHAESVPDLLIGMYLWAFRSSLALVRAVSSLPQGKLVADSAWNLRGNLRQVKKFQRELIASLLLQQPPDPIELIRWKQVYAWPETIMMRFGDAARAVERAKLKSN
jgi:uncharacterized protein Yka (UPF0111/DUF47 family)